MILPLKCHMGGVSSVHLAECKSDKGYSILREQDNTAAESVAMRTHFARILQELEFGNEC